MARWKKNKQYYLSYKASQEMLVDQLVGVLEIEVGNYIYKAYKDELYINKGDYGNEYGLDIYIKSPDLEDYCDADDRMLLHLHPEDILYAILNHIEISKDMIDTYNKYKEEEQKNEKSKK